MGRRRSKYFVIFTITISAMAANPAMARFDRIQASSTASTTDGDQNQSLIEAWVQSLTARLFKTGPIEKQSKGQTASAPTNGEAPTAQGDDQCPEKKKAKNPGASKNAKTIAPNSPTPLFFF